MTAIPFLNCVFVIELDFLPLWLAKINANPGLSPRTFVMRWKS